jgi:ABC-type nickel/cobalt efflux system permease component RcnA
MRLADGIAKHGFRKWYERELTQSHIHLVLLFLCAIGLLMALEVFSRTAALTDRFGNVISLLLCAGVGLWALRSYLYLLMHAEEIANQAVCPECKTYGKFAMLRDDRQKQQVTVRCKCCSHEWPIFDTAPE